MRRDAGAKTAGDRNALAIAKATRGLAQPASIITSQAFDPQQNATAAALTKIRTQNQVMHANRRRIPVTQHFASRVGGLPFQPTAANRAERLIHVNQHACARLARRRAAQRSHGYPRHHCPSRQILEGGFGPVDAQWGQPTAAAQWHCAPPGLKQVSAHAACKGRCASMARSTDSGVAGAVRLDRHPGGPQAAQASRIAWKTDKASIKGGSPTALDLKMESSGFGAACSNSTRATAGQSRAVGIL